MPDGGCIDTPEWLCPDPEEQFGLDPHATIEAPSEALPASSAHAASTAATAEQFNAKPAAEVGVVTETVSEVASELGLHKPSALVVGLGGTAAVTVVLILLLAVVRLVKQQTQRSRRSGGGRRKAKHTKLKGSESSPAAHADDDADDDDDDDDDDDIIGDDDDESALPRHGTGEQGGLGAKPVAEEVDEADLLKKVHSLLDELPTGSAQRKTNSSAHDDDDDAGLD